MITSRHNEKLKRIRKLHSRRERDRTGLFVAEGEDLVEAAADAGVEPELVIVAGSDVEPALLDSVSTLGSGTRVIGVFSQVWAPPGGDLSVYLQGVGDPGNVGTIIRTAHALCDGAVVLGPDCADPYSPKAVRASMGSVFARAPAKAELRQLGGRKLALDARAETPLAEIEVEPPIVICLGGERRGVLAEIESGADTSARIPMRPDGPESLNVAIAAAVGLHVVANRMAAHA